MATPAQFAANKINGSKGGPRTDAGKLLCRDNAMKHGLTARHVILADEDASSYESLHTDLVDHYAPESVPDGLLVDQLAQSAWRLQRARCLETATYDKPFLQSPVYVQQGTGAPETLDDPDHMRALIFHSRIAEFDNLRRHEAAIERAYYRAYRELEKIRKERARLSSPTPSIQKPNPEIGSVLQNTAQPSAAPLATPSTPVEPVHNPWYRRTKADGQ